VDYDFSVFPPAPQLEIHLIAQPHGATYGPIAAFVDTGADATIIPIAIVRELQAGVVTLKTIRGYASGRRTVRTYLIDLKVGPFTLPGVEIVGDDAVDTVLLGRDVLNKLRLLLDGPAHRTQLLE
jgi:predicted aspartyl protease